MHFQESSLTGTDVRLKTTSSRLQRPPSPLPRISLSHGVCSPTTVQILASTFGCRINEITEYFARVSGEWWMKMIYESMWTNTQMKARDGCCVIHTNKSCPTEGVTNHRQAFFDKKQRTVFARKWKLTPLISTFQPFVFIVSTFYCHVKSSPFPRVRGSDIRNRLRRSSNLRSLSCSAPFSSLV